MASRLEREEGPEKADECCCEEEVEGPGCEEVPAWLDEGREVRSVGVGAGGVDLDFRYSQMLSLHFFLDLGLVQFQQVPQGSLRQAAH